MVCSGNGISYDTNCILHDNYYSMYCYTRGVQSAGSNEYNELYIVLIIYEWYNMTRRRL